jgi:hypothetical protein
LAISNHGRTPGILLQYAISFVDIDEIPETPLYNWMDWFEWIGPGVQERNILSFVVPKNLKNPVSYGRVRYRDIFDGNHSSGFILRIVEGGTASMLPPNQAFTDSN